MRCAALEDDGRCLVYDARPIVCRSHGAPVRLYGEADGRRFPMVVACPLNFPAGPEKADADCILDQETLSATLIAVDHADADEHGRDRGERLVVGALLVELTRSSLRRPCAPESPRLTRHDRDRHRLVLRQLVIDHADGVIAAAGSRARMVCRRRARRRHRCAAHGLTFTTSVPGRGGAASGGSAAGVAGAASGGGGGGASGAAPRVGGAASG